MISGTVGYANLPDGTYIIRSANNGNFVVGRAGDASGSNVRLESLSSSATSRTHQQWYIQTYSATNRGAQKNTCYKGADYKVFSASNRAVALNIYGGDISGANITSGQKNAQVYTYSASDTAFDMALYTPPAGQVNIMHRSSTADSGTTLYRGGCLNVSGGTYAENNNIIFWYSRDNAYTGRKNPDGTTDAYSASTLARDGIGSSDVNSRWVFERAIYYIAFNGNGATSGSTGGQTAYIDVAIALNANGFARTGYIWDGWAASASGGVAYSNQQAVTNLSTIHKATATLFAHWAPITWYVRYNGNGSTGGSMPNSSHTYDVAKALTANGFSRTGYTFKNWNRASAGTGTAYSNGQSVSNLTSSNGGIIDVYAQWTPNTYDVSFNANGGKNAPAKATRTYDTPMTLPASAPTRAGHTFLGWSKSSAATSPTWSAGGSYSDATAAATTLYAVWRDDYEEPKSSSLTAIRTNSSYAAQDDGAYGRVTFAWSVTATLDEGSANSATVTGTITPHGGNAANLTVAGGKTGTSGTATANLTGLDADTLYTVTMKVTDKRGSKTFSAVIPKASFIFDVGSKGAAMGLGTAAPSSAGLSIGYGPIWVSDHVALPVYLAKTKPADLSAVPALPSIVIAMDTMAVFLAYDDAKTTEDYIGDFS